MNLTQICRQRFVSGLTRLEVVVLLISLTMLVSVLLPVRGNRGEITKVECTSNLKQAALSLSLWSLDHHTSRFGFQISTNEGGSLEYGAGINTFRHFQITSNQLTSPHVLFCPSDKKRVRARSEYPPDDEKYALDVARIWAGLSNQHVSYFVNLDAQIKHPRSVLLGDANVTNRGFNPQSWLVASSNNPPHWSRVQHSPAYQNLPEGNVAFADGSVYMESADNFTRRFDDLMTISNRLAIP